MEEEYPLGLQMYSVKYIAEDDLIDTLKRIRDIGYESVELVGLYTYNPVTIRKFTKKLGLKIPSIHIPLKIYDEQFIEKNFENSLKSAAEVGVTHVVIPWLPIREDIKKYEMNFLQQLLDSLVDIAKKQKLQLVLHNFSREFVTVGKDQYVLDQLLENMDEQQVQLELDISKIYLSGLDPKKIIERYDSRTPFLHLRTLTEGRNDCLLEEGVIDFKSLLPSLANLQSKVMYIEQQVHKNKSIEDAKKNFEYITQILKKQNTNNSSHYNQKIYNNMQPLGSVNSSPTSIRSSSFSS